MTQSLVDQYGRIHDYLRLSLTDKCNLRCTYCMPEEGVVLQKKEAYLTDDEIIEILQIFKSVGVRKVRITGGEPLVRKGFDELLLRISKLDLKLYITTNGVLLTPKLDVLKMANVLGINISLDTLDPNKFKKISKRDYFHSVYDSVIASIKNGFVTKVNVVLKKGFNDDELASFIDWTKNLPIGVRFIEYMPFDGNNWDKDEVVPSEEVMNVLTNYNFKQIPVEKNSTSRVYKVDGFAGNVGVISTVTHAFCGTCNRMRLTSDGKFKNCLFGIDEVDLLKMHRAGGNIERLIRNSLFNKREFTGGFDFGKEENFKANRSMIRIGG